MPSRWWRQIFTVLGNGMEAKMSRASSSVRCVRAILNEKLFLLSDPEKDHWLNEFSACLEVPWRCDSILFREITLPPLLIATLFAATVDGVVQIDQLRDILNELPSIDFSVETAA